MKWTELRDLEEYSHPQTNVSQMDRRVPESPMRAEGGAGREEGALVPLRNGDNVMYLGWDLIPTPNACGLGGGAMRRKRKAPSDVDGEEPRTQLIAVPSLLVIICCQERAGRSLT